MSAKNKRGLGIILSLIVIIIPWLIIFAVKNKINDLNQPKDIKIVHYKKDTLGKQANHKEFEILKQEFTSPEQVTEACISCHNKRHKEIMGTAHWKWERETTCPNGEKKTIGKNNLVNNYCAATTSNTWKCSSCHIGYGYKDKSFDFTDASKVDCIVCHDNTGTYEKQPLGSGYPVAEKTKFVNKTYFPPNYNYIAQNVGSPQRKNCGVCHFYGGGGDNVKHGDLSSDLLHPNIDMDVHMNEEGLNMTCVECHETDRHIIQGRAYSVASMNENRLECSKCHTEEPHQNRTLNTHTDKIACQTCHIPVYAKGIPTKMFWDWSAAGKKDKMGHKITEYDSLGMVSYSTPKGSFKWDTNVEPEYVWFNGTASHISYGQKIDTSGVVHINRFYGDYNDPDAKIYPVKIHQGKQIYDKKNMVIGLAHVYGHDSTAYKKGLNWDLALKSGMEYAGVEYSGEYDFIETQMYWKINHMVAKAEHSLTCTDCHAPQGRLKNVAGFYMPGRDKSILFDSLGVLLVAFSIIGVAVHGLIRYIKRDCIACD